VSAREQLATPAQEREIERIRQKFRSAGGDGARRKGVDGEHEVVAILRNAGWPAARRTADGRSQAGRGDVAGGPADVHFEIRRRERAELWAWLADAERGAGADELPLLVFRRSRSRWYAALPLDELLALLWLREGEAA
jgi:hypothetical protein